MAVRGDAIAGLTCRTRLLVRRGTGGVFLCSELEDAEWFAAMRAPEPADIWEVRAADLWLVGDPGCGGGGDAGWMVCPSGIESARIRVLRPARRS